MTTSNPVHTPQPHGLAPRRRGPRPGTPAAKRGGQSVREKYGPDFFAKIGKKGGVTMRERYGLEHYAEIGRKGGKATSDRHGGRDYYVAIGRKGGKNGKGSPKSQVKSLIPPASASVSEGAK